MFAFVFVADADLDLPLGVEDVELGDYQRIDAVDHFGVAQDLQVEPAAAARASGDGAKFLAALAHFFGVDVGHFGGKGTAAYAGGIGLGNSEDVFEASGRDADSGGSAAGNRAGRSDVGIGAVVDVQHGALRAFEEHGLVFVERAIDELGGVADVAANFFAEREGFFNFLREIDVGAVSSLGEAIFFGDDVGGFFAEELGIEQIAHAQAAASHFVFIGRADAARGGADFVGAAC